MRGGRRGGPHGRRPVGDVLAESALADRARAGAGRRRAVRAGDRRHGLAPAAPAGAPSARSTPRPPSRSWRSSPSGRAARSTGSSSRRAARRRSCSLLPGLVAFAAAVAASRLLPAAGRRLARRGGPSARLAGVSLARSPGAAGIAAAFLALAVGLAVLAEAYRSTLSDGERDQAAYAVPTDVVVREDLRALVPVRARRRSGATRRSPASSPCPVVRVQASAGPSAAVSGVTVLGVPEAAIRSPPLWRDDWGESRRARVRDRARGQRRPARPAPVRIPTPCPPSGRACCRSGRRSSCPTAPSVASSSGARTPTVRRCWRRNCRRRARARLISITWCPAHHRARQRRGRRPAWHDDASRPGRSLEGLAGRGGATISGGSTGRCASAYAVTPQRIARVRPRQPTDDAPPRAAVTAALAELAGGVGRSCRCGSAASPSTSRSPP